MSVSDSGNEKKSVPLPVLIGVLIAAVAAIGYYGYRVMNAGHEGDTPPAEAHRMMMDYMKRGGNPGQVGGGPPPPGGAKAPAPKLPSPPGPPPAGQ